MLHQLCLHHRKAFFYLNRSLSGPTQHVPSTTHFIADYSLASRTTG